MYQRSLACDGRCGAVIIWNLERGSRGLTKSFMEKTARAKGWHAPDRLGGHWCLNCRTRAGAAQWWRRENVRRGLDPSYGLGKCKCQPGDPPEMNTVCCLAGHPGVVSRL